MMRSEVRHQMSLLDRESMAVTKENLLDWGTLVIALLAMIAGGWAALEAHWAREEAKTAIDSAKRSADAAEKSNTLAARSQTSYLLPSMRRTGDVATVTVKNVSCNVALNIRAGYFLYAGPLKAAADVKDQLAALPLRPTVLALAASDVADAIDTPIAANESKASTVDAVIQIPVAKLVRGPLGIQIPQVTMESKHIATATQVQVPSQLLVIGAVSFEDNLNNKHTSTFCFPASSAISDTECAKLNSLQLERQ
jgi:hypothetical protein